MEQRGISVDRHLVAAFRELAARRRSRKKFMVWIGERINIGWARPSSSATYCSAAWVRSGGTKTKTGQWSTSCTVEDLAAEGHELPRKIVDWRQLNTKLKSTDAPLG